MRVIPALALLLCGLPRIAQAGAPEFNQDFSCQPPGTIYLLDQLLKRAESRWEWVEKVASSCSLAEVRLVVPPEGRRGERTTFLGATVHRQSGAAYLVHDDLKEPGRWTIERIPLSKVDTYLRVLGREVAQMKKTPPPGKTPEEIDHIDRILQALRGANQGKGDQELAELLSGYPRALGKRPPASHWLPAGTVPTWPEFTPTALLTLASESPEGGPYRPGAPLLPRLKERLEGAPDTSVFGWARAEAGPLLASWQVSVRDGGSARTFQLVVHNLQTGAIVKEFDKLVVDSAGKGERATPAKEARAILLGMDSYAADAGLRVGVTVRPSRDGQVVIDALGARLAIDAGRETVALRSRGDKAQRDVLPLSGSLFMTCPAGEKPLPVRIQAATYLPGVPLVAVRLQQSCPGDAEGRVDQDWHTRIVSVR